MNSDNFFKEYEAFQKEHPELEPEWKEFIEPVIQSADDAIFGFIMGYILV